MKKLIIILGAVALLAGCNQKKEPVLTASGINPDDFVASYNEAPTALYTLTNAKGMEVCITNFGGRIVSILVPDKDGNMKDVVLGFDKVADYFPENNQTDFGASIGRYANRINQARSPWTAWSTNSRRTTSATASTAVPPAGSTRCTSASRPMPPT